MCPRSEAGSMSELTSVIKVMYAVITEGLVHINLVQRCEEFKMKSLTPNEMYKLNMNQMQGITKRSNYYYLYICLGLNPWLRDPQTLWLNLK